MECGLSEHRANYKYDNININPFSYLEARQDGGSSQAKEKGADGTEAEEVLPCYGYHQENQEGQRYHGKRHPAKGSEPDRLGHPEVQMMHAQRQQKNG